MNAIVQLMNNIDKNTEDHFKILRKIQKDPKYSQRQMADELGFSLVFDVPQKIAEANSF